MGNKSDFLVTLSARDPFRFIMNGFDCISSSEKRNEEAGVGKGEELNEIRLSSKQQAVAAGGQVAGGRLSLVRVLGVQFIEYTL